MAEILAWVRAHPLRGGRILPVCFWGPAGVGKTAMVSQFASANNLGIRVYHPAHDQSGEVLVGRAYHDPDTERTHFAVPYFLPTESETTVFARQGILFIDEINRATQPVIAGLFELIGEDRISQSSYELPDGWQIVCAANPEDGEYRVTHLDGAMLDRMLHVWIDWDPDRWISWAAATGLEEDVVRFAASNRSLMGGISGQLPDSVAPAPTPRALEYFAALYEPDMPDDLLRTIAEGLLGREAAEAFTSGPRGQDRPLSGEQIIAGVWRRYLPRWSERPELIARSLSQLVGWLGERQPDFDIARAACEFRAAIDPGLRRRLNEVLAERSPGWLTLMDKIDEGLRTD